MILLLAIATVGPIGLQFANADKEVDFPEKICPSFGMNNIHLIVKPSGAVLFGANVDAYSHSAITLHIDGVSLKAGPNNGLPGYTISVLPQGFDLGTIRKQGYGSGIPSNWFGTVTAGLYGDGGAASANEYQLIVGATYTVRCN